MQVTIFLTNPPVLVQFVASGVSEPADHPEGQTSHAWMVPLLGRGRHSVALLTFISFAGSLMHDSFLMYLAL